MEKTPMVQSLHVDERYTSVSWKTISATAWQNADNLDDKQFQIYLQQHGLTKGSLSALLSGQGWIPRADVSWFKLVKPILLHGVTKKYHPSRPLIVESTQLDRLPFSGALESVVANQCEWLNPWRGKLRSELLQTLTDSLAESLANISIRCFVNEFTCLQSNPTETRTTGYNEFNESLKSAGVRDAFYAKYPMLARLMIQQVMQWRKNTNEFLDRLVSDERQLIAEGFVSALASEAVAADSMGGDPHNGGSRVLTVSYSNGDKVMYKPRDCGAYDFYHGFIRIINESKFQPFPLLSPKSLTKLDYGWVEYIPTAAHAVDLSSYEIQMGSVLAVCHALGSSDMHMDNIIASVYGPVPIDLETIVQNRSIFCEKAIEKAVAQLNSTVLGTGILPTVMKTGENTDIDVSAFSGSLKSQTATITCIVHPFTDAMTIKRVNTSTGRSHNQPENLKPSDLPQYGNLFMEGFSATYQAILDKLSDLTKYVRDSSGFRIRCVMRPTRSYSMLLSEMRQPSRMHSGIQMDDLLRKVWSVSPFSGFHNYMCWDEELQLRHCDIPLFQTDFDSTSLFSCTGKEASNYYRESARSYLAKRLLSLGQEDLQESINYIQQSFLTIPYFRTSVQWRRKTGVSIFMKHDRELNFNILDMAYSLQRDLIDKSICGKNDVTWNTMCNDEEKGKYEIKPIGYSLYDGAAGLCVALTHAYIALPNSGSQTLELASRIALSLCDIINDWTNRRVDIPLGAFSGISGLIYACTCYMRETGHKLDMPAKTVVLDRIQEESKKDTLLDIMSGSAGACAVLASGVLGQDDSTIQITKQLAQRIIRQAVRGDDDTLAWPQKSTGIMLGGFAHGATGIGWALSKTADFTNSDEIHDYAVRALAFDNQFFDKERGLWRDARSTDNAPSYPMRWCHGAPGIIMAQYDSSDYKQQNDFLGTLAKRIIVSPLDSSDCLCYGTLGNWLALKNILSSYEKDAAASDQYLRRVISRIRSEGAKSGILSGQLDSVGLMLGESGWLTALLIKLDPSIPNPLLLELPTS